MLKQKQLTSWNYAGIFKYSNMIYHLRPADKSYFTQFEDDDYGGIA